MFYFISTILLSFSNFFINYYLSQKLSLEDYGHFSLIYGAIGIVTAFIMLGQATAITSVYFSDEKKYAKNIHNELLSSYQLMIFSSLIVISILFIGWNVKYRNDYTLEYLLFFCISIVFYTFQTFFMSFLTLLDKFKTIFLLSLFIGIILIANIIINPSINGFFIGIILSGIVSFIFGIRNHYYHNKIENIKANIFIKKDLFKLGWIAIPGMLLSSLNAYLDRYIIEYYFDLNQVAYYSLAATLSIGIGMVFVNSLVKGSIVTILKAIQDNDIDVIIKSKKNIQLIFLLIALFLFIINYFIGKELVIYIFGEKYKESFPFMLPLFYYALINGMGQIYGQVLVQKKKLYIFVYISIVSVLNNILFSIIFINIFGIKGVVFSLLLSSVISLYLIYNFSIKYQKYISFPYLTLFSIAFLAILSLVI